MPFLRALVFAAATLALAVFVGTPAGSAGDLLIRRTAVSLLAARASASPANCNILLGLNTNLDLVSSALETLAGARKDEGLARELDANTAPHDFGRIATLEQLEATFLSFFSAGSAAERFVSSTELFDRIVSSARRTQAAVTAPGGNAALMANRAALEGCRVRLAGPVGPALQKLLHPRVVLAAQEPQLTDEVHLILEYARGAKVAGHSAPRANRFILTSDVANARLDGLSDLEQALRDATDDGALVVLAGLHLLEGIADTDGAGPGQHDIVSVQERRIQAVEKLLSLAEQRHVAVHWELASMTDPELLQQLWERIGSRIDSIGLNEQELAFLAKTIRICTDVQCANVAKTVPDAQTVETVLAQLLDRSPRISRVHFHSLAFHTIAIAEQREKKIPRVQWKTSTASVAAGSIAASAQACGDQIHPPMDGVSVLAPVSMTHGIPHRNSVCVRSCDTLVSFYSAPVLVCDRPQRTVGLGDAISSAALSRVVFSVTRSE